MTKPETIKTLEERYKCHIERETYSKAFFSNEVGESFKIYSKDGCHWSTVNGYKSLIKELADSKQSLRRLANLQALVDQGY